MNGTRRTAVSLPVGTGMVVVPQLLNPEGIDPVKLAAVERRVTFMAAPDSLLANGQ